MDPILTPALIAALATTSGGVMTSQASREQKLKELEQQAMQDAIKQQGNAFQSQGQSAQNAYNTMLQAYRGIL